MDCNNLDKRTKAYKDCIESKKGLGDMVADVTKAVGIKPCEGCKKRQEKLNVIGYKLSRFFKKHQPNPFTPEDKILWGNFRSKEEKIVRITNEEQELIIRLLRDVLNASFKPCKGCDSKTWTKYIKMINLAYEEEFGK